MQLKQVFVVIIIILHVNLSMGFLANLANTVTGIIGRGLAGAGPMVANVQNAMKQAQGQQMNWPSVAGGGNPPPGKGIAGSVAGGITKLATWIDGLLQTTGTILYTLGGGANAGGALFNYGGLIPPANIMNGLPPGLLAGQLPGIPMQQIGDGRPNSKAPQKTNHPSNHANPNGNPERAVSAANAGNDDAIQQEEQAAQ